MGEPGMSSRGHARRCIYYNGFIWGIGNGLFSTSLIRYLIRDICHGEEYHAIQAIIAWVIAAPRIAGLLRLFTPSLLDYFGNRKKFVISCYLVSPIVLCLIPFGIPVLLEKEILSIEGILAFLVIVWCLYHLVENLGTIAYWSWLAEFAPSRIHGRMFGMRERWLVAGVTIGAVVSGLYTYWTGAALPTDVPRWSIYILPSVYGIGFLFFSAFPLFRVPEVSWKRIERGTVRERLRQILEPLKTKGFLPLLFLGCWIQISMGISQSVQFVFQMFVLGISLLLSLQLQSMTRIGQLFLAPFCGRWIDKFGTFPVMFASLSVTSLGSFFYLIADKESWWLVIAAAFVWIFWVGANIGLPKMIFRFAPEHGKAAPISLFYTMTTLSLAISTLIGGYLADQYGKCVFHPPFFTETIDYSRLIFLVSGILRVLSVVFLVIFFVMKIPGFASDSDESCVNKR